MLGSSVWPKIAAQNSNLPSIRDGSVTQWVESYRTNGDHAGGPFGRCKCGLLPFTVEVEPIEIKPIDKVGR